MPSETHTSFTDPDTDRSRLVRAFNQFETEPDFLQQAPQLPCHERVTLIRTLIFRNFPDVWGRDSREIVLDLPVIGWPSKQLVGDIFWPAFTKHIDTFSQEISELSEVEKETSAIRLAVLAYFFGVLMHPSIDGNGQTFRLLALSYIRQHSTRYADAFFPIKYVQDYGASLGIHPVIDRMVQEITQTSFQPDELFDEQAIKESILATLLTTRKSLSFLRNYIQNKSCIPANSQQKTASIFKAAFDSLEQDFLKRLESEPQSIHIQKHIAVQKTLKKDTLLPTLEDNRE